MKTKKIVWDTENIFSNWNHTLRHSHKHVMETYFTWIIQFLFLSLVAQSSPSREMKRERQATKERWKMLSEKPFLPMCLEHMRENLTSYVVGGASNVDSMIWIVFVKSHYTCCTQRKRKRKTRCRFTKSSSTQWFDDAGTIERNALAANRRLPIDISLSLKQKHFVFYFFFLRFFLSVCTALIDPFSLEAFFLLGYY